MSDKCREAFEQWSKANLDHSANVPEEIKGFILDGLWSGWQAAWNATKPYTIRHAYNAGVAWAIGTGMGIDEYLEAQKNG